MIQHLKPRLPEPGLFFWEADLSLPVWDAAEAWKLLSSDEKERAQGYRFPLDKERFILRRALLRLLLSFYAGIEPAKLVFRTNEYGKLFLDMDPAAKPLFFNLSHSGGRAVYVFSALEEPGVDIEKVEERYPWERVAGHFCSEEEQRQLQALPDAERQRAFFDLWTCKEACLKASGQGLSALAETKRERWADFFQCRILPLDLGNGYAGHIAVKSFNKSF